MKLFKFTGENTGSERSPFVVRTKKDTVFEVAIFCYTQTLGILLKQASPQWFYEKCVCNQKVQKSKLCDQVQNFNFLSFFREKMSVTKYQILKNFRVFFFIL